MSKTIGGSLKQKTVSNMIWKFLERFLAQGVSLIVSVVLARLLTPEDFGVVSLVTIFFVFANVIISGGLNTALIQKKNADIEDYSTILHISVLASVFIYILLFILAPQISILFNQPSLTLIIRIMSLSLPVTAVKSIWSAYISSNLLFKRFFFATLGGTLTSAVVGIVMAIRGFGPWALVAQQMTNTFLDTLILILTTRLKVVPRINFRKFKELFKYGWKILASGLIGATYSEFMPFFIGIKFSSADLSFYTKGRGFPNTISSTINYTLSSVLFPVLSKFQDDKEKVLLFTRHFMKVSSFIIFPIMLGFLAVADNFVFVLLSEKWMAASFYIRIFCIALMFDVVAVGNCETIKALGRSGVFLIMEIIKKSTYFVIMFLFVFFADNPQVLAISSLACAVVQIIVNSVPNKFLVGYHFKDQIIDILPNLIISIIMAAAVTYVQIINNNSLGVELLVKQIAVGISIYFVLAIATNSKSLKFLIGLVKRKKVENN